VILVIFELQQQLCFDSIEEFEIILELENDYRFKTA
jgi:acyl carrier protein